MKAWVVGKLTRKPLFTFSLVSLVLIAVMVILSGYTQSKFFLISHKVQQAHVLSLHM